MTKEQDSPRVKEAVQERKAISGDPSSTVSVHSSMAPDVKPTDTTLEKSEDRLPPTADTDDSRNLNKNNSRIKSSSSVVKPSHIPDANSWGSEDKHLQSRDGRPFVDTGAALLHSSHAKPSQEKDARISQAGPVSTSTIGLPQRSNVKISQSVDSTVPEASGLKMPDSPASADDWQLRPSAAHSETPPDSERAERGSGKAARDNASEEHEPNHTFPRQPGVSFTKHGSSMARSLPGELCAECGHVHPPGKDCILDPDNL